MILLDTNALIWLQRRHPRAAPLSAERRQLYISPISLLEIQVLSESGRLRPIGSVSAVDLLHDRRWTNDDPSSTDLVQAALTIGWTRDIFDRLLVAHARLRRWRLATADTHILAHLAAHERFEL